jgi:hypothetical protein
MTLDFIIDAFVTLLILPLQVVLIPIDALLAKIPGISAIPQAINGILQFIGSIPSTMVSLTGINPFIWNSLFLVFLLFVGLAPAIQIIKKVWAWVRP